MFTDQQRSLLKLFSNRTRKSVHVTAEQTIRIKHCIVIPDSRSIIYLMASDVCHYDTARLRQFKHNSNMSVFNSSLYVQTFNSQLIHPAENKAIHGQTTESTRKDKYRCSHSVKIASNFCKALSYAHINSCRVGSICWEISVLEPLQMIFRIAENAACELNRVSDINGQIAWTFSYDWRMRQSHCKQHQTNDDI